MKKDEQTQKGAFNRFDAADYLSISTKTLDGLATSGKIPKIKIGRKTLFRRKDLDEFLANCLYQN